MRVYLALDAWIDVLNFPGIYYNILGTRERLNLASLINLSNCEISHCSILNFN